MLQSSVSPLGRSFLYTSTNILEGRVVPAAESSHPTLSFGPAASRCCETSETGNGAAILPDLGTRYIGGAFADLAVVVRHDGEPSSGQRPSHVRPAPCSGRGGDADQ